MRRTLLLAGLCLALPTALAAAVEAAPEARQEYKSLYPLLRKNDLWTTLLWEDWARGKNLRLKSALPGYVLGSSAFATPEDVRFLKDRGDYLEVLTNHRWYQFANDGHPNAVPLIFGSGRLGSGHHGNPGTQEPIADAAFSYTPGMVAELDYVFEDDERLSGWHTRVIHVPDGRPVYESTSTEPPGESPTGWVPMAVADDGSAVALTLRLGIDDTKTIVVVSSQANNRAVNEDLRQTLGVGPNGSWLIADAPKGDDWLPVLVAGGKREMMRTAAVGPGIAAAVRANNTSVLVHRDGTITELQLPISLGDNPRMATVGRYLVVSSGANAVSLDNTDFFGVPLASPPPQPECTICIPWDQLGTGAGAAAGTILPGTFEVDHNAVATIYLWKGQQASVLDLSGGQAQERPFYQASGRITWLESRNCWTNIYFVESSTAIINDAGKELWSGTGYPVTVSPEYAVLAVGDDRPEYSLIRLDPDSSKRTVVRLDLSGKGWGYELDPFSQTLVCHRDEEWITFDCQGNPLARGGRHSQYPIIFTPTYAPGRFSFLAGRMFTKDQPLPLLEGRLCPNDAWLISGERRMALLTVDRDEHVMAYLKERRSEPQWQDLGRVANGRRFGAFDSGDTPVVVNDGNMELATIIDGKLKAVDNGPVAGDLPQGAWQVDPGNTFAFVPPGMRASRWSEQKTGFLPKRLRSAQGDESPLVVATASLVLVLSDDDSLMDMVAELPH